jgi:hypothetical protein
MRAIVFASLTACAVSANPPAPSHPANAAAPIGRLAGAPAALRPGVVAYPDVPPLRTEPAPEHHHHQ